MFLLIFLLSKTDQSLVLLISSPSILRMMHPALILLFALSAGPPAITSAILIPLPVYVIFIFT